MEEAAKKHGRMLLWAIEFWVRALMYMMDGVLEKLWEEEIKKDIPIPEFMLKKDVTEYTLEDQRQLRDYEEKVRLLELDRRKFLRILHEREDNTNAQKTDYILRINEKCADMGMLKLKYDFAIKHLRLRILNNKILNFKRLMWQKKIKLLRKDVDNFTEYIDKYTELHEAWEDAVGDVKLKLENLQYRDRSLDKYFKGHFINAIPAAAIHEINKLYKKRVKITQRSFNSTMVCYEVAQRLTQKSTRMDYPLPQEVIEYINIINSMDDPINCPGQLDAKQWEQFIKLRRQKIESELKIKGTSNQLFDVQGSVSTLAKDVANLKAKKMEVQDFLSNTICEYVST